MSYKIISTIRKCWNMVAHFFTEPSKTRISERDIAEWKSIEGIDQYHKKSN